MEFLDIGYFTEMDPVKNHTCIVGHTKWRQDFLGVITDFVFRGVFPNFLEVSEHLHLLVVSK